VTIAAEEGAGTIVSAGGIDCIDFAVVLEPEFALAISRLLIYAAMNAAGLALATHGPPERTIGFEWPDMLLIDGGLVGGARLAFPGEVAETDVPDWVVAGVTLRRIVRAGTGEPGEMRWLRGTGLEAEGFSLLDTDAVLGSFTRHLMAELDLWLTDGFVNVAEPYLSRLAPRPGTRRGIDHNGDLLIEREQCSVERLSLLEALGRCRWRDGKTGDLVS
jgi:hypothetical protein